MNLRWRILASLNCLLPIAIFSIITATKTVEAQTTALDCLKEAQNFFNSAIFGSSITKEKVANFAAELCRKYQTPETLICAKEAHKFFDGALFGNFSNEERKQYCSVKHFLPL